MSVPERFKVQPISGDLISHMSDLCDAIEDSGEESRDGLLEQWHKHAGRKYEFIEFKTYWKAVDQDVFVREALRSPPLRVEDVTYSEAVSIYEYVVSADGAEDEITYYLEWLEAQFPDSDLHDLIYWPDEWFGDPGLFRNEDGSFKMDAELSTDQILGYAMAKSGRKLMGAPDVELPFPLP